MLDKKVYKHTIRLLKTNCFLTATTVRRTNFNVTFISTFPIVFIVLIEIRSKNPLPVSPPHHYMFE
jgi:hypothetical protein